MPLPSSTEFALRAAGFVGTWNTDVQAGRSVLDEGAATLLAGNAALAGERLPLEVALGRTHPADRDWVFDRIRRARRTGGPFSAEWRITTEAGEVRWILTRGVLAPDEAGMMRGQGIYVDTTDHHSSPFLPSLAAEQRELDASDPLITAADRCLEAHTAILQTGHSTVRRLSDTLLWELGRALARRERS